MPNLNCHRQIGRCAGAVAAIVCAQDQDPLGLLLEAIGGVLGGDLGGRLPDGFDPPIHSYHRSLGHGVAPSLAVGRALVIRVPAWQEALRDHARRYEHQWQFGASEKERNSALLRMTLCRLLAGAIPGLIAGYASHLVLDLGTPRSLPLIG